MEYSTSPHLVGKREELVKTKRKFITLEGRDILMIAHQDVIYALDYYCYHAATGLTNGDIEELGGKLCIICPKHFYKLVLKDGECIYRAGPNFGSKGIKQRVHTVTESNGDVYVTLSQVPGHIDSDQFQGPEGKIEREKIAAKEAADKKKREEGNKK